jgi:hypothetical protein
MAISRRLRFEILRRDGHTCRYCGAMAPDVKLTVDHVIPTALGGSDEPANLVTACVDCNSGKASTNPDSVIVEDVAADALRWSRALQAAAHNLLADRELIAALTDRFLAEWQQRSYSVDVPVPPEPVEPTGDVLVDNWRALAGWTGNSSRPVGFADGVLTIQTERGYVTDTKAQLRRGDARRRLAELLGAEVERIEVAPGWPGPLPAPPRATTRTEKRHYPLPSDWRDSVARFASLGLPEGETTRLIRVAMDKRGLPPDERFRFFCGCCWRAITDLQEDARRIIETET